MASVSDWTPADTEKARQIWADYQRENDVTDKIGMTAGIEPHSGRVWLGESIGDVIAQRNAEGVEAPLFFERVGFKTYFKRGSRGSVTLAHYRRGSSESGKTSIDRHMDELRPEQLCSYVAGSSTLAVPTVTEACRS